ncbi:hypothetical protein EJB05_53773, partial [Eragrostis curvula]
MRLQDTHLRKMWHMPYERRNFEGAEAWLPLQSNPGKVAAINEETVHYTKQNHTVNLFAIHPGEWWEKDPAQVTRIIKNGYDVPDVARASTINGKLGDRYNCSGSFLKALAKTGTCWTWRPGGKTYLLRVINSALFSEFYLKIAGHNTLSEKVFADTG